VGSRIVRLRLCVDGRSLSRNAVKRPGAVMLGWSMSVRRVSAGSLRESSTQAARDYVLAVRQQLALAVARDGPAAAQQPSYRRLADSISPVQLRRCWPAADLDEALGSD
jgi:hypothetical protein